MRTLQRRFESHNFKEPRFMTMVIIDLSEADETPKILVDREVTYSNHVTSTDKWVLSTRDQGDYVRLNVGTADALHHLEYNLDLLLAMTRVHKEAPAVWKQWNDDYTVVIQMRSDGKLTIVQASETGPQVQYITKDEKFTAFGWDCALVESALYNHNSHPLDVMDSWTLLHNRADTSYDMLKFDSHSGFLVTNYNKGVIKHVK